MIRLMQDRVLVKPSIRQLSEVLIVNNRESFNMGTIVAVGPGKRDKRGIIKPLDAKAGDSRAQVEQFKQIAELNLQNELGAYYRNMRERSPVKVMKSLQ